MRKRIELKQPIDSGDLDVWIDGKLFSTVYAVDDDGAAWLYAPGAPQARYSTTDLEHLLTLLSQVEAD